MTAIEVMAQKSGEVTKAYYDRLNKTGPRGELAVALFRAQKRSDAAKSYRGKRFRRAAYDVKSWSMDQIGKILESHALALGVTWGWKEDPLIRFGDRPSHVLYVDLPEFGQVSFHSPYRGKGPEYQGNWDGQHRSQERIMRFCDSIQ